MIIVEGNFLLTLFLLRYVADGLNVMYSPLFFFWLLNIRHNALRGLFEQLESQSTQNMKLCDSRKIENQHLENELEVWKDKAESYELQLKQNTKDFE